jgi:hypothetical protein
MELPFRCPECAVEVIAVTAVVDPKALDLAYHAQCGHLLAAVDASALWDEHGYRWTVPVVDGASLIAAERLRQVREEGFTPAHDAAHGGPDLAWAAHAYLARAASGKPDREIPPVAWPWPAEEWKPDKDSARLDVIAGAMVAAEIDRLLTERRTGNGGHQQSGGADEGSGVGGPGDVG